MTKSEQNLVLLQSMIPRSEKLYVWCCRETGQSISSYIRFAKVERARVLLVTTDLSIREIADKLAFSTENYFIRCFREITGYTPARYRRRFQHNA